jgi:hypothetical protein
MASNHDLPPLHATRPGLYRHYKGGWYEVIDTVRCSETLRGMTLYRALYGDGLKGGGLWVRPSTMFNETAVFDGREQPRFRRVGVADLQPSDLPTAQAARGCGPDPCAARATARTHHLLRARLQRLRVGGLLQRRALLGRRRAGGDRAGERYANRSPCADNARGLKRVVSNGVRSCA